MPLSVNTPEFGTVPARKTAPHQTPRYKQWSHAIGDRIIGMFQPKRILWWISLDVPILKTVPPFCVFRLVVKIVPFEQFVRG